MRKTFRRFLALLLALVMAASLCATGWATELPAEERGTAANLEMEDLDPVKLHVQKLGEVAEDEEESVALNPIDFGKIVRVSIFLEDPATLDAGYSVKGVSANSSAIAYRESLKREQAAVTAAIERATGSTLDVKWNMTLAVNAISANVRYGDIVKIGAVEGVKKVVLENRYEAPREEIGTPAEPNTANTSENMVGATTAWAAGYTGAGSRIAIIDTGLDTAHQSFAEEPFTYSVGRAGATNELLTKAQLQSLASQLNSKSSNYISAKIPYGYNYVDKNTTVNHQSDTEGEHGSHVAGIAAANRYIGSAHNDAAKTVGAVGMAPDAQLFVMKVFGAKGGAYDSDYMVAIEDAIVLDCDSVNLSLGSAVQGFTFSDEYQDIMNNLADKAHNEGMVVSISAGNSYDFAKLTAAKDLYKDDVYYHTGGTPGTFVNSLCVAAAQNTITKGTPMEFNGSKDVFYTEDTESSEGTAYTNPALTTIAGSYSYVYIDATGTAEDYAAVNSAASLSGKIVIVNRGDLSFVEKGENAKSYNPKAVIIANNEDGVIHMDLTDFTGTFPMVGITLKDANLIKADSTSHTTGNITYYTGSVKVTTTEKEEILDRSEAKITDFSSWGVPGSLLMKPEITAPGGDIYSVNGTHNTKSGTAGGTDQYEYMSGTSMAAPHITGLAAVVAEYLRENPVADRNKDLSDNYSTRAIIQSLLMSTATPMKPENSYLSVLQQGAGLADVNKAVTAPSVLMMNEAGLTTKTGANADGKVKVELGDDPAKEGKYSYSFTLYNLTNETITYKLNTELFTQKISGEFLARGTSMLPTGGVTYVWKNGAAPAADLSHDVNKDGVIDGADAQAILDFVTCVYPEDADFDEAAADLDEDKQVTSYDAYLLLTYESEEVPAAEYTLVPKGTAEVVVTISLTDAQKAFLEQYATGAYLEGFTYVTGSATTKEGESLAHTHSIPILGFYGSWTDPSMFDNMSYVDGLYGADRLPYSGNSDTNYLRVNYNGTTVKFSGNPYMVEDEFPADRLALSSNTTLVNIAYNQVRAAGTTGYAVTKLDDGNVSSILNSAVTGNEVTGMYYSNSSGWQNTTTKSFSINKTVGSYGLKAGDRFRVGYYAIPEYNAMLINDSYNAADSGVLGSADFNKLLTDNVLGKGAFVGYDFTVDNEAPVITNASLNGNTLSITASDNQNLAYVAVLSLDGTVKYAEKAPGTDTYTVSFDASDAIANARGYVAAFAGDYAGNEAAKAVKVNNNSSEDPYAVSGVTVTPAALDLYKGNTADLVAKVVPLTAADRTVTWSSSNNSIATVDENGQVTAVGKGTATITATANGDSTKKATCTVTVEAINKALNAIVWDEEGQVFFSDFNANNLPTWTKKHNNGVGTELLNAYMADASTLYASTCDVSDSSVIYSVNRNTYALTEFGTNYVPAFGMARGLTGFSSQGYDFFLYGFGNYLVLGGLAPEEDGYYDEETGNFIGNGEYYTGMPYATLNLSTTGVGDAYVCAVAARTVSSASASYYFLDETGKIWQTTMSIGSSASFGTPTLVIDTGINTSFMYQSLYYDKTNIYWSHFDGSVAELIIINPSSGKVYHAGNFGEGVWPAAGLYVNGSAAPSAVEDEVMDAPELPELAPLATRDELMTADVKARLDAEAQRWGISSEPEAAGGLNAVAATGEDTDQLISTTEIEDNTVTITLSEDVDTTNGLITVLYDPNVMSYQSRTSDLLYQSVAVDEEKGVIWLAYASKDALPADTPLLTLKFAKPSEVTQVEIQTLERGEDVGLAESEIIVLPEASKIASTSVSFDGKLFLNTYIKLTDEIKNDPNAYVSVTFNDVTTKHNVADLLKTLDSKGRVKVRQELFAAMMRDEMTLQLFNGEDKVQPLTYGEENVTNGFVYTALKYLKACQKPGIDAKVAELARAAELYGIATQVYFNYKTEQLTDEDIAMVTAAAGDITIPESCAEILNGTQPAGITKRTLTVMFQSDNSLRQYFYIDDASIGNYTFMINGAEVTPVKKSAGRYYVEQQNIASGLLSKEYTFTVSDGTDTWTIQSSALSYAYVIQEKSSETNIVNLVKLLYRYSQAADAYFHK